MRDGQPSPPVETLLQSTMTPPRHRNSTPSISPLSTTSQPKLDLPAVPLQPQLPNHIPDHDGDSSSLSDFDAEFDDQKDADADSEAETERLEASPQKPWKIADITRTPSKLNQAAALSDHPSSPEPMPQSPSPTSRVIESPSSVAGRKRKRPSPASDADSPLSEHSDPDEPLPLNGNGHHTAMEDEALESARQTPEAPEMDENPYISPMKAARLKRAKQKASLAPQKVDTEPEEDDVDEQQDDDEQDRENKRRAAEAFSAIAEQFQTFRAKLHSERLASAEAELDQLNLSHPTHPDYLAMLQCITARRDIKIQQEARLHEYKLGSLRNQTLAERAQLHGQFFQEAREIRERTLQQLGKQWYDIQKERRQWQTDQQDNYSYKFPLKRSDQVRYQDKYNREVSILSGMAKYRGFPAAPDIQGARPTELDQDFKAMHIPRPKSLIQQQQRQQQQQPPQYQNHANVPAASSSTGRTAEERFIEQTPWANPQHPFHQQSRTPGPFAGYGVHVQANNSPAVNLLRQSSAHGQRTNSPFSTPLPNSQKRNEYHANGLGSNETIGIPSDPPSSINAAPPTADRFLHGPLGDISPTDQLEPRPAMSNPLLNREDRRNFSGLSSASTIDMPSDPIENDRPQTHYTSGMGHNRMPPTLPIGDSAPHQTFVTSAMHTQNGKPDERKQEVYENVNFRRPQLGAFGTPMPLFANGSPARHDGQKAS